MPLIRFTRLLTGRTGPTRRLVVMLPPLVATVVAMVVVALAAAPAANAQSATVNVKENGARGDGSDATAAISAALAKIPAGGGTLVFPSGNYLLSGPIALPSNTHVRCEGAVITAAPAGAWSGGRIDVGFGATSGSNFEISGCQFRFPYRNPNYGGGHAHILEFVGVSHVNIHDNVFDGGGDAVAQIGTTDTWEVSNRATNLSNACYDHWGGFTDAHTNGNFCSVLDTHGRGVAGIQFTGIASGGGIANSNRFEAIDNTLYINHNDGQCIEINGHKLGGSDDNGRIIGNRCVIANGYAAWGILVSGRSTNGEIADNVLEGNGGKFGAVNIESPATGWNVHDNVAINWDPGRHQVFENAGETGQLTNNRAFGSCAETPQSVRRRCSEPRPPDPRP